MSSRCSSMSCWTTATSWPTADGLTCSWSPTTTTRRLLPLGGGPPHLRSPRAALDQLGRHSPQLWSEPVDLLLQRRQRDLPPALQLVVQLPPQPGRMSVSGSRRLVVRRTAFLDRL